MATRSFSFKFLSSLLLFTGWIICSASATAQEAQLIDLNESTIDFAPNSDQFRGVAGSVFFVSSDPSAGAELWISDGTRNGTRRVRDICPGTCSSNPSLLQTIDGRAYLYADDGVFGRELWTSDGTRAGTVRVKDICPGPCSSGSSESAIFQGRLIFGAVSEQGGSRKLWSSDGTREGTKLFAEQTYPTDLRAGETQVFFRSFSKLFRSDGTPEGTYELFHVGPGTQSTATMGDELFLRYATAQFGEELWKTDGTPGAPTLVADICPGSCDEFLTIRAVRDGFVYFTSNFGGLFRTDGDSTEELFSRDVDVEHVTLTSDAIYLHARHWNLGKELWRVDETGVHFVQDLLSGPQSSSVSEMVAAEDHVLIHDREDRDGEWVKRLWFSDGTPHGTVILGEFDELSLPEGRSFGADGFTKGVVFAADRGAGMEPWISDGTREGTKRLTASTVRPGSGSPELITAVGDRVVMKATSPEGSEVWSSDGTPEGSFAFDEGPRSVQAFSSVDGEAVYTTTEVGSEDVAGLWATDGTTNRLLVDDIRAAGPLATLPDGGFVVEATTEELYNETARELWTTDLTPDGTQFLREITFHSCCVSGPPVPFDKTNAYLLDPSTLRSRLVFAGGARDGVSFSIELWSTDGSEEGTERILSCSSQGSCPSPRDLTRVRGLAVFSAYRPESGRELWRTRGGASNTRQVLDLVPGPESSSPHDFHAVSPRVVWFFAGGEGGESLWQTDGSARGTFEILNLDQEGVDQEGAPSFVVESAMVGDRLFFALANDVAGVELWVSDGSADGTHLVKELVPGSGSAFPQNLTAFGDLLLFSAQTHRFGQELWVSDGTRKGTRRLTDIARGWRSSAPTQIRVVGTKAFFSADDDKNGRELWSLELSDLEAFLASGEEAPIEE